MGRKNLGLFYRSLAEPGPSLDALLKEISKPVTFEIDLDATLAALTAPEADTAQPPPETDESSSSCEGGASARVASAKRLPPSWAARKGKGFPQFPWRSKRRSALWWNQQYDAARRAEIDAEAQNARSPSADTSSAGSDHRDDLSAL